MKKEKTAYVGNIQHFNVHDGNGFRTTIFFQGCNLRCKWCQNPELQPCTPIQMLADDEAKEDSSCPMTINKILEECDKESFFYKFHGGGVTLSGGEPLLQIEFIHELLVELKKKGYNVCIETAGHVPWGNIECVLPYVDTFLWDVKLVSNKRNEWIGANETTDLDNLKRISRENKHVVVRIPLVPKVNDGEEFDSIIEFINSLQNISYIHILPFHQIGSEKYSMINKEYEMKDWPLCSSDKIAECKEKLEAHGYYVNVGGTGFTYL